MKKNTPKYMIIASALAVACALIVPAIAQDSNSSNKQKSPIFPEVSGADGKMSPEDAAKLKDGKKKGGKKHPGKKGKKK